MMSELNQEEQDKKLEDEILDAEYEMETTINIPSELARTLQIQLKTIVNGLGKVKYSKGLIKKWQDEVKAENK